MIEIAFLTLAVICVASFGWLIVMDSVCRVINHKVKRTKYKILGSEEGMEVTRSCICGEKRTVKTLQPSELPTPKKAMEVPWPDPRWDVVPAPSLSRSRSARTRRTPSHAPTAHPTRP